ncbi:ribosome small subunit-dependent GTPase A [Oleispirillum naphthae]|uniref:ribosome small subunit-dependent GTPase A n=1 Tax=Oleispirillum naphthae TaxID=2838853 RepID=UPI0030822319
MTSRFSSLADLGWTSFFASQFSPGDSPDFRAVRVMAVHRGLLAVAGDGFESTISSHMPNATAEEDFPTIGDWLVVERTTLRPERILRRASLFKRRAAGTGRGIQLIAANVDTLFVVSSCDRDFNPARLERYLILAREAGVMPVVVLTKADRTGDAADYANAARRLLPGLVVETLDARDADAAAGLGAWCGPGQTVALLGSSGVGKSTLINSLSGSSAATGETRADDDKGRHTTTARELHRLERGGWLLDTPGMRELQLADAHAGTEEVFDDVTALAQECRFSDCSHDAEPGCAIKAAIAAGSLDPERLARWRKLAAEESFNTASLAERRARDRTFGKMVRAVIKDKTTPKRR